MLSIERTPTEARSAELQGGHPATRLQQAIDPARARLLAAYTAAREKSNQAMQSAESYIQRSPFKAVACAAGIAAAIGILGGALLGWRNGRRRRGDPE
jgi:ElaB/YqjD/DUF883 family membrane-anchored ribosome-binding protein